MAERGAITLPADALFVLWLDPGVTATRAGVAAALAGRTPLALHRACWGFAVEPDGRVRVVMAHRSVVLAAEADRVTGDGVLLWERRAVPALSPWWMLAAIPALTGLGAWALTLAGEARLARIRPAAEARARAVASDEAVRTIVAQVPVSSLLARVEAKMPAGATLHAVTATAAGGVEVTVDAADPGRLRAAFAGDPLLARLRTVGQELVADRGIRMRLRMEAR